MRPAGCARRQARVTATTFATLLARSGTAGIAAPERRGGTPGIRPSASTSCCRPMRLLLLTAMVCVALAGAAAAPAGAQAPFAPDPRGVDPSSPTPLAGPRWFVDRQQPAWRQYRSYRHRHRRRAAKRIWKLAREPKFRWFGRFTHPVSRMVRLYIRRA